MRILGIDPGGTGAIALLDGADLVYCEDMPVLRVRRGKGTKAVLDIHAFDAILSRETFDACYFEEVQGMEGDGVSAAHNFGRITGATEALVKRSGARFTPVRPPVWKKAMGLIRAAKDDSRAKAMDLWPAHAQLFRRKMDDGRAEAALIAEYGQRQERQIGILQ